MSLWLITALEVPRRPEMRQTRCCRTSQAIKHEIKGQYLVCVDAVKGFICNLRSILDQSYEDVKPDVLAGSSSKASKVGNRLTLSFDIDSTIMLPGK